MTIKRKAVKVEPPSELPPARLYLDDIQEVMEIFREASKYRQSEPRKDDQETVRFETKNETCDTIEDLKQIGGSTNHFLLTMNKRFGYGLTLRASSWGCSWSTQGLTDEGEWYAYAKFASLFKARKVWWKALMHAIPTWTYLLVALVPYVLTHVLPMSFMNRPVSLSQLLFVIPLSIAILAIQWMALTRSTVVVFRPISERSVFNRETALKTVPTVAATLLGILGTLLVTYLKHKYWP
jgi:hypothetical protein